MLHIVLGGERSVRVRALRSLQMIKSDDLRQCRKQFSAPWRTWTRSGSLLTLASAGGGRARESLLNFNRSGLSGSDSPRAGPGSSDHVRPQGCQTRAQAGDEAARGRAQPGGETAAVPRARTEGEGGCLQEHTLTRCPAAHEPIVVWLSACAKAANN